MPEEKPKANFFSKVGGCLPPKKGIYCTMFKSLREK